MLDVAMRQAAVGAAIRRAREAKGWKQRQLAAQIPGRDGPINTQTVSNWERGVHEPDIETLEIIAAALEQPISYFVADGEALGLDREQGEAIAFRLERALDRLEELLGEPPEARDEPRSR
jgi:transcriptional regulator with XRE-family HTH domain